MRDGFHVLDCDIHVIEPPDLWEQYLDPAFRDRAPTAPEPGSQAWLTMHGKALPAGADTPERTAAMERRYTAPERLERFLQRGEDELHELAHGTTSAGILKAMDTEGIDVAVTFRTKAAHVIAFDDQDPVLSGALCRAFNRWLAELCAAHPHRLKLGAQVPLQDAGAAVAEAEHALDELDATTLVLPSHQVNGRALSDPHYDPLWKLAEERGVAVSFHGIQASYTDQMLANRYPENPMLGHAAGHPVELMLSLGAVLTGGVATRFPRLRFAFLEGNCSWLPWWLWALDERWEKWGDRSHPSPSELFRRQCWVATEVDEPFLPAVIDAIGDDNLVLSSDWPHDDSAYPHAIESFLDLDLPEPSSRKILWDNCARLYGIGEPPGAKL